MRLTRLRQQIDQPILKKKDYRMTHVELKPLKDGLVLNQQMSSRLNNHGKMTNETVRRSIIETEGNSRSNSVALVRPEVARVMVYHNSQIEKSAGSY